MQPTVVTGTAASGSWWAATQARTPAGSRGSSSDQRIARPAVSIASRLRPSGAHQGELAPGEVSCGHETGAEPSAAEIQSWRTPPLSGARYARRRPSGES